MIIDRYTWGLRIVAALLMALFVFAVVWSCDPGDRRRKANERADQAQTQSTINANGAAITGQTAVNTAEARRHAEEAKDAIHAAPDVDHAVAEWRAGRQRVRDAGKRSATPADRR